MMTRQGPPPTRLDLTKQLQIYPTGQFIFGILYIYMYLQRIPRKTKEAIILVLREDQWLPGKTPAPALLDWDLLRLPQGGDKLCGLLNEYFSLLNNIGDGST